MRDFLFCGRRVIEWAERAVWTNRRGDGLKNGWDAKDVCRN